MSLVEPIEVESASELDAPSERLTEKRLVSAVIRVRNAAGDLRRCLSHLRRQTLPRGRALEIIVVDNESTDGSADVARQFGAEVVPLGQQQFTWGRALNVGIRAAGGEVVLLLSADAYAADDQWLCGMLKPFEDSRVGVVYGRQMPRADAPIDEIARLASTFGNRPLRVESGVSGPPNDLVMSNACAAIRREAWELTPYDESLAACEEKAWTNSVLRLGWAYVYAPQARVFHSHRDPVLRFGLRAAEFLMKGQSRADQGVPIRDLLGFMFRIAQSRVRNVVRVAAPARAKVAGLVQLPFELTALLALVLLARSPRAWTRVRAWGWA